MIRTQIQLTHEQATALKRIAAADGVSMAEVVRRAVDDLVARQLGVSDSERRRRAIAASGRFASGRSDVAEQHDAHLAEIYGR